MFHCHPFADSVCHANDLAPPSDTKRVVRTGAHGVVRAATEDEEPACADRRLLDVAKLLLGRREIGNVRPVESGAASEAAPCRDIRIRSTRSWVDLPRFGGHLR